MISKEQLLTSILDEFDICIHIDSKIKPEEYSFQPWKNQRSILLHSF